MADPVTATIAGIGLAAGAAGGIVGAGGAEYQARATSAQQNYQAQVAEMNARVAQQDAEYARAAGETTAQEIGMKGRAEVGTTMAHFGASNIGPAGPSSQNVLRSETAITQFEEGLARSNAAKQAFGFEVRAASETAQAGAFRAGAQTALVAGDIGATSSILGGVGSVSSKWLQGQSVGVWGGSSNPNSAYS